jgi:hypothetical protein
MVLAQEVEGIAIGRPSDNGRRDSNSVSVLKVMLQATQGLS